ncbi:hypothetical protein PROFUN_16031, partial [Planoprotostelium fungivorum]
FLGTLGDDFYKKLNSRSDLALILGVLKQYRSAEESDDSYTCTYVDEIKTILCAYVKSLLGCIHLSLDGWTSDNGNSFQGIILHGINQNKKDRPLVTLTLALKPASAIAASVKRVAEEYRIVNRIWEGLESNFKPQAVDPINYWLAKLNSATDHHHCLAQMALDVLSCPATSTDVERCQVFATISQCLCFPPSLLLARGLAKGSFPVSLGTKKKEE